MWLFDTLGVNCYIPEVLIPISYEREAEHLFTGAPVSWQPL